MLKLMVWSDIKKRFNIFILESILLVLVFMATIIVSHYLASIMMRHGTALQCNYLINLSRNAKSLYKIDLLDMCVGLDVNVRAAQN